MKFRKFGDTEMLVSELGFGMWPIGGTQRIGDYGVVDLEEAKRAIKLALESGINLFDSAPAYGNGHAEEVLGDALEGIREKAIITTKCAVSWNYEEKTWIVDSSRSSIIESVERSLARLKTDWIDILLIHVPDPKAIPEDVMSTFDHLQRSGKVKYVGVSNFTIEQIQSYQAFGTLNAQQSGYNLFDRRIEKEMISICRELKIGLMTYGALCHGLLSGTWTKETTFNEDDWRSKGDVFGLPLFTKENFKNNIDVTNELKNFAKKSGHTLAQLAIAWVLHNADVAVALAGMCSTSEVRENIEAIDWTLTLEDLTEISKIMTKSSGKIGSNNYIVNS